MAALLVAALLLMPAFEGIANGVYEAFAILVVMPLIVSIGAGSQLTGGSTTPPASFWATCPTRYTSPTCQW